MFLPLPLSLLGGGFQGEPRTHPVASTHAETSDDDGDDDGGDWELLGARCERLLSFALPPPTPPPGWVTKTVSCKLLLLLRFFFFFFPKPT